MGGGGGGRAVSAKNLLGDMRVKHGRAERGARSIPSPSVHAYTQNATHAAWPRWVLAPHGQAPRARAARTALGFCPGACLGSGARPGEGGGRGAAPVHGVLPPAPTGKPASSPERGSLFVFFFVFFFSLSTPLPASTFCSLPPPLPAAAKPQNNFRAARDPPHPQLWAGCYKTPERFGRPQACPTDAQSRNGALHKFPNLCLEQRELCNKPSGSLAALHKVFTEREEGRTDNMFLRLSYCTR